jgi:hypothetical protein
VQSTEIPKNSMLIVSVPFMSWCSNWAGRSGRIVRGQMAVRPASTGITAPVR